MSEIDELIQKSRKAQKEFERFSQEQVDLVVKEIAKTVYDNAELLAKMAVEETKMGVYEHKVSKNKGKSKTIWNDLKNKKSVDIIKIDEEKNIIEIAKPMGVVGSVTPTTNPTVTCMCNAMFALKGRNSIIIAPHPRAKTTSLKTVELINESLKKYNSPENLIQIIKDPSIQKTEELMKAVDVVVATGGMGVVKAAYSSGKPAYGVGAGNVQVILDNDIDYEAAAEKIISGRAFDNGIICSGEQSIIVDERDYEKVVRAFESKGAFFVRDQKTKEHVRSILFINGQINKDVVGQSVKKIAEIAGLNIPENTKVIIVEADGIGKEDVLCKEKMCPVMVSFKYKTFDQAIKIAKTNLELEGSGHTAAIHSNNNSNIEKAGISLPVSRLVVNAPSSTTAGGSLMNGFAPTTTLGCGSWGNNSISENFTYKHLINISRIGFVNTKIRIPTDEEIWA
jgi:succinate-semialdehyde dehydrogenase